MDINEIRRKYFPRRYPTKRVSVNENGHFLIFSEPVCPRCKGCGHVGKITEEEMKAWEKENPE